ncbi:sugar dehydrogenase [Spirosoma sp. HMF4905]|uniref:Sugar dehydrogenase n=1 Tax=Spirosoma arboris TaxID=2682092 RepID=A0A7K1SLZ5_9BACT|nr:PQQ-dependent sugar dehydrogenase [Spirosoma arboris]MVM34825.1 sugar dehydrogenase [Spirosoma arboris]
MVRYILLLFFSYKLAAQSPKLRLSLVTAGLNRPTDFAARSATEFLVAQTDGKIQLIRNGVIQATPFLNISSKIRDVDWEGIFGITLHPNYAINGYMYVHYSRLSDRASVFARYTRKSTNPDQADPASELIYLTIPYTNPLGGHRSGRIGFGPDGYLYITTGDSSPGLIGTVGDPDKLAQNLQGLYGKVLRIDVNQGNTYAIPPTNPYANPTDGIPDELFALGLRNPWRWSFDRQTGDFWVGDVGQDDWDELNFTAANSPAPQNYGWPCFEGSHPYNSTCPTNVTYHMPLLDYAGHNSGVRASVTGGFVYRGTAYPTLQGWYVYGDYERGTYWILKRETDGSFQNKLQSITTVTSPVSFGEASDGELYVLSFADGKLYHLTADFIASVQSGSWMSPTTWDCNCLPTTEDNVAISKSHVVFLNQQTQAKSLRLTGSLMLANGGNVLINSNVSGF